jgi:hypothetical protein
MGRMIGHGNFPLAGIGLQASDRCKGYIISCIHQVVVFLISDFANILFLVRNLFHFYNPWICSYFFQLIY